MSFSLISRTELRKFGLTFGVMIALMFGLVLPFIFSLQYRTWPWIVAALAISWAGLAPSTLRFVYKPWMKLAEVLGAINSRIILGLIFFLMIVPMALVMKILGKSPLRSHERKNADTYRLLRENDSLELVARMEKPF